MKVGREKEIETEREREKEEERDDDEDETVYSKRVRILRKIVPDDGWQMFGR